MTSRHTSDTDLHVAALAATWGVPAAVLTQVLHMPRGPEADGRAHTKWLGSAEKSEILVGVVGLLRQVDAIVAGGSPGERGPSEGALGGNRDDTGSVEPFSVEAWLVAWLDRPYGPLGPRKPAEWMDTAEGRERVGDCLARMAAGAYA